MSDELDKQYYPLWAKDATLRSLLSSSDNSNVILKNIAKSVSKDDKAYTKMLQELGEVARDLENLGGELGENTKAGADIAASTRDLKKTLGYTAKTFDNLSSMDSRSLFGSISNAAESFSWNLGKGRAGLSRMLGTVAVAAEVFDVIWKRGTQLADAVMDLYDNGLVFSGGLSQLAHASNDTGLDLQTLSKVLTKHGQVVSFMGIAKTNQLGKEFAKLTNNGSTLGMSMEESQDIFLSYADQLRMSGQLGRTTDEQLKKGAIEYGQELNRLSQSTGKRRSQLDAEIAQQLKKPDIQLLINSLAPEMQEAAKKGLAQLNVVGTDAAGDLQTMFAQLNSPTGFGGLSKVMPDVFKALNMFPGGLEQIQQLSADTLAGNVAAQNEDMARMSETFQQRANELRAIGQKEAAETLQKYATSFVQAQKAIKDGQPTPADAQAIADAQKSLSRSLNTLNNGFTLMAAKVLTLIAKPLEYLFIVIEKTADIITATFEGLFDLVTSPLTTLGKWFTWLSDGIKNSFGWMFGGSNQTNKQDSAQAAAQPMSTSEIVTTTVAAILSGGIMYKLMGGMVKTFRSGANLVKGLFTAPGLKNLPPVPGLNKLGSAAADAAGGAAKSAGGMASGMAGGLADSIKGAVGDALRGMASLLTDVLSKLSEGFKTVIGNIGKGLGDAFSGISKGLGELFANLGDGIGKAISSLARGISSGLTALAEMLGKAIASVSEGLGKAFAAIAGGIGKGVGVALGAILEGLSIGLKAMADPMILLGAAILGGSITLIGAGIAGATWIMGAALPKMAEGLKAFTDIDGTKLEQTGNGMIKIGAGLAAMGAGEVVRSLGSLTGWISSFFTEDPITKLKRFGEIAEPMKAAADALGKFADAYPRSLAAMNNTSVSQAALESMDRLKLFFKGDTLFNIVKKWLVGSEDVIPRLQAFGQLVDPLSAATEAIKKFGQSFGELTEPMNAAAIAITQFSEAYAKAIDLINASVFSDEALDTLDMLDYIFREGAFVVMGDWLLNSDEIMTRLANLETETGNIPVVADRLYYFADAYSYLVDAFADPISLESLTNLYSLSDLINRQAYLAIPNVISSAFGATAAPDTGGGPETTNTGAPAPVATGTRTAHLSPEQRHKEMMAALNLLNNNIENLLMVNDRQVRVMSDGFGKVSAIVY